MGAFSVVLQDRWGNALLQPDLQLAGSCLSGPTQLTSQAQQLWCAQKPSCSA